jgi:hypothetical protein
MNKDWLNSLWNSYPFNKSIFDFKKKKKKHNGRVKGAFGSPYKY